MSVTFIITFLFCVSLHQSYTITQQVTNNDEDDSCGGIGDVE